MMGGEEDDDAVADHIWNNLVNKIVIKSMIDTAGRITAINPTLAPKLAIRRIKSSQRPITYKNK